MKKNKKTADTAELNRRIRGDWGVVKPYVRVFEDKRRKEKYKKGKDDYE